jgi:asparagine synthase (glutamine-hydrolysing)
VSCVLGIRRRRGPALEPASLRALCVRSRDAGPDGQGVWLGPAGDVGLGCCVLDLGGTAEPARPVCELATASGAELAIAADVRLDNRDELVAALAAGGDRVEPELTDDALMLRCYRAWGEPAFARLVGDFAAVLWDGRDRRLRAVRDGFGVRPLYWWADADEVRVASEPRQLGDAALASGLEPEAVSDYLHHAHRLDAAASFRRGVALVRPGHVLTIDDAGAHERRFWALAPPAELSYPDPRDYAEHLAEVLGRAVAARCRGARPAGLLLSGGLDSSAIAALGVHRGVVPVAYTAVFDRHPSCDERPWVRACRQALGLAGVELEPEREALFARSPAVDEPDAASYAEPHWDRALAELAARGGRTMMVGDGGETLLFGTGTWVFVDALRRRSWTWLAREAAAYRAAWGAWPTPSLRGLAVRALPALAGRRPRAPSWLDPDPAAARARWARYRSRRVPRVFAALARQHAFERVSSDLGDAPGWWPPAQHAANRRGCVYTYPYLDRRVQELVYAIPVERFYARGRDRAVLRDALAGRLPELVRERLAPTAFDAWFARVGYGPELAAVLATARWPELEVVPTRAAALAAHRRRAAPPWQLIALGQLVAWYNQRET